MLEVEWQWAVRGGFKGHENINLPIAGAGDPVLQARDVSDCSIWRSERSKGDPLRYQPFVVCDLGRSVEPT